MTPVFSAPRRGSRARSVAALAALATVLSVLPAAAEHGRLLVIVKVADNVLAGVPARASVVTPDGTLVDYAEDFLERAPNVRSFILDEIPPGTYDVRVEAEGMVTEVKRGAVVFADRDENLSILVRPGQGVHIVEYAVAGLSREEVAARLAALDAETTKLRAELTALKPPGR